MDKEKRIAFYTAIAKVMGQFEVKAIVGAYFTDCDAMGILEMVSHPDRELLAVTTPFIEIIRKESDRMLGSEPTESSIGSITIKDPNFPTNDNW
jgi:hypothetical protein